jgi:hypothetical protein
MTPRALLTAIGATAIGFAVVIGSAASAGFVAPSALAVSAQTAETEDAVQTMAYHHAMSGQTLGRAAGAGASAVLPNEDCPIAL